jgi:hypothetical protein
LVILRRSVEQLEYNAENVAKKVILKRVAEQ